MTLNGNHLTGIGIDKILDSGPEHTCGKLATDTFLQTGLVDLNLLCQIKNINDILVCFESDGTKQSGHR